MKRIVNVTMLMVAFLYASLMNAQKETNKGTTEETTITTIKVNNGKKVQKLTKEVTIEKQDAIILDTSDKHKLNQDYKVAPTKVVKTTILKDKDTLVSKDVEVYYEKGNEKYTFKSTKNTMAKTSNTNKPKNTYIIKSKEKEGVCYFTQEGMLCVEYVNDDTGEIEKNIYTK